jgi:hypothetical protein
VDEPAVQPREPDALDGSGVAWVRTEPGRFATPLWGLHVPAYTSEGWWTKHVAHFAGHRFDRMELLELPGFASGYRRVYEYFFIDVWFYEGRQTHVERRGKKGSARHASAFIVIGNRRHMPTHGGDPRGGVRQSPVLQWSDP